jgi:hypothetical protein
MTIMFSSLDVRRCVSALLLTLCAFATAAPTFAGTGSACGGAFTVFVNGSKFTGTQDRIISAADASGNTLAVIGQNVGFLVDLDTFTVTHYSLLDARTGRTEIFASKVPEHNTVLTSDVSLRMIDDQLVLVRAGSDITMKILASDCASGNTFQMRTSRGITFVYELAAGMRFGTDQNGRTFFTNGTLFGRETAALGEQTEAEDGGTIARFKVDDDGRVTMAIGSSATK